jgi:hypothetical protein
MTRVELLRAKMLFQPVNPRFSYAYAALTEEEKSYHTVTPVQNVPRYSIGMQQTEQNKKKLNSGSVNFVSKEDRILLFCIYIMQILID